ncbi:Olfactory receptor 1571 [Sciurus carolinensis]|uniref:Olfactory receptor 1571 n=1 Tax=Sciurus carolinensis TaxID=30640 RepID=A0AA41TBL4_SCICA|nr:Olfactory receptor 1571 [Sciurus carolinensis]
MYLVTVLGNLLIILATISDSHLHTPMYFFLSNLSFVDICFTSTTLPKMLVNIQKYMVMYFASVLLGVGPLAGILYFYCKIVSSICKISSTQGRYKAFSTCASHLSVVSLFYGTGLGVYLSSPATHSPHSSATTSVMYNVVTPMLNPFIYSLRNKDVKRALRRLFGGQL